MENKVVMFVDDEKYILRSLKRLLKNEPFESQFMQSGEEALVYLENNPVDIIVSDTRMTDMSGLELLTKVRAKYPDVLRVALCGFTESRSTMRLVDKNIAKLYLFKPWDNVEMLENIRGMLDMKNVLMSHQLLELINKLDKLPSLPKMYNDISSLIDTGADISEVAAIVEKDQAISSKILKLANSAFYGRKTGDINQAIMGIGLKNLKNIVLSTSLFTGPPEIMQEVEMLWEHALNTNRLTHMIYEKCLNKKMPSLYGAAGLLHDIGKLILHLFYQKSYHGILNEAKENDVSLVHIEMEHYKVTHQDIGAYLLNWWELPFAYVEAAMFHHRPSDVRVINHELVNVVHLANYYSLETISPDGTTNELDATVFSKLKLNREDVELLVSKLND